MPSRPRLDFTQLSGPARFAGAWLAVESALVFLVPGRGGQWPLVFDTAYMPFRITAAVALYLAARDSTDPAVRRGWLLLFFGQLFGVAGNSTWLVSDITGQETENLTYLAWTIPQNVLTLAGFWKMMHPRDARETRDGDWIDAAMLVVSCATIAWYFIAANLVSTVYGDAAGVLLFFFDTTSNYSILLFAAAVWLRSPRGVAAAAMPATVIGLVMQMAGDLVIEDQLMRGTYTPGSPLDVVYGAAIICLILGAEAQRQDPTGATARPPSPNRADALVFGALAASLIPLVTEVITAGPASNAFSASALGVVVLMLLVIWRQRLARSEIGLLIANRLALEHQLWQAQKLESIGRLAGGIAHDFNNILAAISSHAQLLRASPGSPTAAAEAGEIIFATERAAVLVRRLLTFSGATSPVRKAVVLGDVVTSMQPMLRQLPSVGVTLEQRVEDERAVIRLADGQLEQVLLNLALNARDATGAGGAITVSTRREMVHPRSLLSRRGLAPGAWAVLEVKDTGSGMDAATREQIFEPFFTSKAASSGSGLGLATVAGIVHAAEGHVLVESEPGLGTTMSVFLPLVTDDEQSRNSEQPSGQSGVHSGTILIVDDELPIRSALARYLSRLGYRVLEAADVAQALSQAEQHGWRLDLVLTDAQLPYASGLELSEQLRQRCPGIPRLFMTDRAHGPARRPANEIPPVADRIDKPFDLHLVAERVRAELRNRR